MTKIQTNSNVRIIQTKSADEAGENAAEALMGFLEQEKDHPILFLSSGGSCLGILNNVAIQQYNNITIGVLDERFTDDPTGNNFLQLEATAFFREHAKEFAGVIRTVPYRLEHISVFTERCEKYLRDWKEQHDTGKIIATVGIGKDGHTSGMLPSNNPVLFTELFEGNHWVSGYRSEITTQWMVRVTTTMTFLREVDHAVVYACGSEKKHVVSQIVQKTGEKHQIPGMVLHEMKDVVLVTDQSVGSLDDALIEPAHTADKHKHQ